MKIFTLVLLFITFGFAKSAELTSFKLVLSYDGLKDTLVAGYSDSTTQNFDEKYEEEYPPFPPPSGIILSTYRIMRYYSEVDSELIYSRYDYRATPGQDTTIDYDLDILGTRDEGREFYMYIPQSSLPKEVKSVQIIDKVLNGKLIDSNIVNGAKLNIDNRFIKSFIVRVTYDINPTSVEWSENKNIAYFYDNTIHTNDFSADKIKIYSVNGQLVLSDVLNSNSYNLTNLTKGIYFVNIYDANVVIKTLKIIKL